MGLLTQQTDLKSLKYGKDRFDGGSSVQPFIKFPTPNGPSLPEAKFGRESLIGQTGGVDQLTRGGSLLGESIANDLSRIGKFLLTPQGFQFIAKQQGLIMGQNKQLYGNDPALWPIEYNPLSILSNVAGVGVGNHFPNVTFKFGKNSDTTRASLYREGNTYQLNSVRKTAAPSALIDNITYQPLYIAKTPDNDTLKDTVNFYISKTDGKKYYTFKEDKELDQQTKINSIAELKKIIVQYNDSLVKCNIGLTSDIDISDFLVSLYHDSIILL